MDKISNEQQNSTGQFHLPPGFRFHPSDEELIVHYLRNKLLSIPLPALIITEIDLYKYNPWELPSQACFGEAEWFFFTPRDRKYPNGNRPNRAAGLGFWKATGTDKNVISSCGRKCVGVKKALVFYEGRPPKGVKTDWIMSEYRLLDSMNFTSVSSKRKGSMRLDDWVLCRVRKKTNHNTRNTCEDLNTFPSHEPRSYYPGHDRDHDHDNDEYHRSKRPKSTNTSQNLDIIIDYLYKDFPMLPFIFAGSQSLDNPPKWREDGSKDSGLFLPISDANESLFINNISPNKNIAKSIDHRYDLVNISSNPENSTFLGYDPSIAYDL